VFWVLLSLALGLAPAAAQLPGLPKVGRPAAPRAAAPPAAASRDPFLVAAMRQPRTLSMAGDRLLTRAIDSLPDLGAAVVVLIVFFTLYRVSARLLAGVLRRTRADPAVHEVVIRLTKIVIFGFGVVMAAGQLGFQVGSVLAGLGIAGLAVGLAAQDTLANLVAGITILWDHPFRIGDNVTIAGTFGQVKAIGLRTTRIQTGDHLDAILPNKTVINEKILNHTANPQLRLSVPVGIGYDQDIGQARAVLLAAVEGHARVLAEPAPRVVVRELAASSVNLELRVWLRDAHAEREILFELLELVKTSFDKAGIKIPTTAPTLELSDAALLSRIPKPGARREPAEAAAAKAES